MIELSHVTCGYGGRAVVSVDDLCFGDGELTCVVGTNGSGKSTLLKAIAGALPHEGSICVDGLDVRGLSHRERAHHLGFLPQRLAVPAMSLRTLVGHGRFSRMGVSKVLGEGDRAVVREALELCELEGLEERQLESLSGGELQRAYLAMAIAQEPCCWTSRAPAWTYGIAGGQPTCSPVSRTSGAWRWWSARTTSWSASPRRMTWYSSMGGGYARQGRQRSWPGCPGPCMSRLASALEKRQTMMPSSRTFSWTSHRPLTACRP